METKRSQSAAVVLDGNVVVIGGYDGMNSVASVEEYNPQTGRWTSLPSMGTMRSGCAAVALDGKVVVAGG
eukprot:12353888-Ditylum_brightwellii.AAC.1